MESEEPGGTAALSWADPGWPEARGNPAADSAAAGVAALYQHHAVGLIRLAYLMLGDRAGAEDAVQDAFCGLYRHWDRLADRDRALAYVRTSVLNGCRSALRRRATGRALENKLRAALRDTAGEIPADPPPLRLPPARDPARPGRRRWIGWAAPLAAAALVLAVVAASLAVVRGGSGRTTSNPAGPAAVPPYYVALTAPAYPDVYSGNATAAEVRATTTGAVLAKVVPPKPYVHFAGVTAAADHRTFVLVAEEKSHPPDQPPQPGEGPHPYYQPSRFYLLRFDPGTGRVSLRALPAAFIPANAEVHDMALSPDGTSLAADIGLDYVGSHLIVFGLATGTERAWSFKTCASCHPSGGGLGYVGTNVDALSWTADGKHVAFVGPNRAGWPSHSTVRLLDVTLPGPDLLADSRPVAEPPPGEQLNDVMWRGAIITPTADRRDRRGGRQRQRCSHQGQGPAAEDLGGHRPGDGPQRPEHPGRLPVRAGDVLQRHRERPGRQRRAQGEDRGHPARAQVHADPVGPAHSHGHLVAGPGYSGHRDGRTNARAPADLAVARRGLRLQAAAGQAGAAVRRPAGRPRHGPGQPATCSSARPRATTRRCSASTTSARWC